MLQVGKPKSLLVTAAQEDLAISNLPFSIRVTGMVEQGADEVKRGPNKVLSFVPDERVHQHAAPGSVEKGDESPQFVFGYHWLVGVCR